MDDQKKLRKHLMELLEGRSAHVGLDEAIKAFPIKKINERVKNSPHTPHGSCLSTYGSLNAISLV